MMERPSPSESAKLFKVGAKKKGNDGNIWMIVTDKNGTKRWKKYKIVSEKSVVPKNNLMKEWSIRIHKIGIRWSIRAFSTPTIQKFNGIGQFNAPYGISVGDNSLGRVGGLIPGLYSGYNVDGSLVIVHASIRDDPRKFLPTTIWKYKKLRIKNIGETSVKYFNDVRSKKGTIGFFATKIVPAEPKINYKGPQSYIKAKKTGVVVDGKMFDPKIVVNPGKLFNSVGVAIDADNDGVFPVFTSGQKMALILCYKMYWRLYDAVKANGSV